MGAAWVEKEVRRAAEGAGSLDGVEEISTGRGPGLGELPGMSEEKPMVIYPLWNKD